MKTPLDILLARHQATAPKLDTLRRDVINSQFRQRNIAVIILGFPTLLWRELVWPSRRIWMGLAAIWLFLLGINFSMRDHSQATMAKVMPSPPMILAFRQQQQLMSELLNPTDVPVAEPKKPYAPRPGSQRRRETTTA